jgi:hypothetical protein
MQASRPGGTRAGRRGWAGGWGASRRLACLLLVGLALSGHARRTEQPDTAGIEAPLVELLLERDGRIVTRGSGVAVASRDENGERACYLVTVGHVVPLAGAGAELLVGVVADGGVEHRVPGHLLRRVDAGDRDLAVVRATGLACRPARLGDGRVPVADVWLAGFPTRGLPRVWPGHLSEPRQPGAPRWMVDGGVTEGASGGGVFDARSGKLVGLIQGYWTARLVGPAGPIGGEVPTGATAVIPLTQVRRLLQEWGLADLLGD